MSQTTKYTSVSLSCFLVEKIKKQIRKTGFKSVSDYVTFVLREIVNENEPQKSFSKRDREQVKKRLRNLGYIK